MSIDSTFFSDSEIFAQFSQSSDLEPSKTWEENPFRATPPTQLAESIHTGERNTLDGTGTIAEPGAETTTPDVEIAIEGVTLENGLKANKKKQSFKLKSKKNNAEFFLTYSRLDEHIFPAWLLDHPLLAECTLLQQQHEFAKEMFQRLQGTKGSTSTSIKPRAVNLVMEYHKCTESPCLKCHKENSEHCSIMFHFHVVLQYVGRVTPQVSKKRLGLYPTPLQNHIKKEVSDHKSFCKPNVLMIKSGDLVNVFDYMHKEQTTNPLYNTTNFEQHALFGNYVNTQQENPQLICYDQLLNRDGKSMGQIVGELLRRFPHVNNLTTIIKNLIHILGYEDEQEKLLSLNNKDFFTSCKKSEQRVLWKTTPSGSHTKKQLQQFFKTIGPGDTVPENHCSSKTLIITGATGIGKSHLIREFLKENNLAFLRLNDTENYGLYSSKYNWEPQNIKKDAFIYSQHNMNGAVLVFDDFNYTDNKGDTKLLGNAQMINIADVSWKDEKPHSTMVFKAKYKDLNFPAANYAKIHIMNNLEKSYIAYDRLDTECAAAVKRRCYRMDLGDQPLAKRIKLDNN